MGMSKKVWHSEVEGKGDAEERKLVSIMKGWIGDDEILRCRELGG